MPRPARQEAWVREGVASWLVGGGGVVVLGRPGEKFPLQVCECECVSLCVCDKCVSVWVCG